MQYSQFCQSQSYLGFPASVNTTADLLPNREIKELSIVKMNVRADFSATSKQWQKTVHWLGKLVPG
jgi:hypothetical protein